MTRAAQITVEALIASIDDRSGSPLDDLEAAAGTAQELVEMGDQMIDRFVARARNAGHTWAQIGQRLGVSRQAAQQRLGSRSRSEVGASRGAGLAKDPFEEQMQVLVSGPVARLGDVPRSTGGPAGVFTIWMHGDLISLGHARLSADEARASNKAQSDGARGRLVGVRRQPPARIQRALRAHFGDEVDRFEGTTEQKRVAALLNAEGEYRMVATDTGADAAELHAFARTWLPAHGSAPLADQF